MIKNFWKSEIFISSLFCSNILDEKTSTLNHQFFCKMLQHIPRNEYWRDEWNVNYSVDHRLYHHSLDGVSQMIYMVSQMRESRGRVLLSFWLRLILFIALDKFSVLYKCFNQSAQRSGGLLKTIFWWDGLFNDLENITFWGYFFKSRLCGLSIYNPIQLFLQNIL